MLQSSIACTKRSEWPKRLETFPDWLGDMQTRVAADHNHWRAVVEKSYLDGLGIMWTNIRNVMDKNAVYGGFAAALSSEKVWAMNVVSVHAPDTLLDQLTIQKYPEA